MNPINPIKVPRDQKFTFAPIRLTEAVVNQLIAANVKNRNSAPHREAEFAKEMSEGSWDWYSPQGNTFTVNESIDWLLDGQTRLAAIKRSGAFGHFGFLAVVPNAKANDVFATIDTGRLRSSGQTLGAIGMKNSTSVAAICRTLLYEIETKGGFVPQPKVNALAMLLEPAISSLPFRDKHVGVGRPFSCPMIAGAINAVRIGVLSFGEVCEFLEAALGDIGNEQSATKHLSRYFQRLNGAGGSRKAGQRDQFVLVTKLAAVHKAGKRLQKIYLTDADIEFARSGDASVWDIPEKCNALGGAK